ncbi:MAG: hypothetical protein ACRDT0_14430 [Pseudonocardiaceae bacterium]
MRTLVIGDHFVPAKMYVDALVAAGQDRADLRTVDWAGTKAEQHAAQQVMERHGPAAVAVPDEILAAAGDAEARGIDVRPVHGRNAVSRS